MNKKQKNRKILSQNKRNKMINRRYTSTVKSLSKLLLEKIKKSSALKSTENKIELENSKKDAIVILSSFYSILDKGVKKRVLHKNKAARKKAKFSKLISLI